MALSLRGRLSLLSVGVLLSLLVVSGIASYVALGAYQRINEAGALDRRYDVTLREFRFAAGTLARPGAAGCAVTRANRPLLNGSLNPAFAQQCIAPAFAGQQITAAVVGLDGGLLACATTAAVQNDCAVGATDLPSLTAGDYIAAANGRQRRYYLVGTGSGEN